MRPTLTILAAVLILASFDARTIRGAAPNPKPDQLERVQGRWERVLSEGDKAQGLRRGVKEVSGNKETITFYGDGDRVLQAWTVDFKLENNGDIHVFTYSNMEIVDGANKGEKMAGPASYVYRVDGDYFSEVNGLLPGQADQLVTVVQWKRVKAS